MYINALPPYRKWRFAYLALLGLAFFNLIFLMFGSFNETALKFSFAIFSICNLSWEVFQYYYGENRINSKGYYYHRMDYDYRDILSRELLVAIEFGILLYIL